MKVFLMFFLISLTVKASNDYYLDVYDSRTKSGNIEVVFEYKGCVDKIIVTKEQFKNTINISKWLKSLKKMRDEGISCVH